MDGHPIVLAGSVLLVSPLLPALESLAGYAGLNYTQVRGVKLIGDIGTQYATVLCNSMGIIRPYQRMTGLAEMSVQVELIRVQDDGQGIMRSAVGLNKAYSYCVRRPDASMLYFSAQINALMNGGFDPKSVAEQRCSLAVVSKLFEVD